MFEYFLIPVCWLVLINYSAFVAGFFVYRRVTGRSIFSLAEFVATSLVTGLMLFGFALFLLSVLQLLVPVFLLLLVLGIAAGGTWFFIQNRDAFQIVKEPVEPLSFFVVPLAFWLYFAVQCFVPVYYHDSMVYHLTIPRMYLDHQGMVALAHNLFFNMPHNIEMLYTLPMAYGGGTGVKLLTFEASLLIFLGFLIFCRHFSIPQAAPVLALLYVASPTIQWHLTSAYIEILLACFLLYAHLLFLEWWRSRCFGVLLLSAVMGSWVMGCKYTAWFFVLPLQLSMLYALFWYWSRGDRRWRRMVLLMSAWVLPLLPWLIKNWIVTGNPVYPAAYHLFGGAYWSDLKELQLYRTYSTRELYSDPTLLWSIIQFITNTPELTRYHLLHDEHFAYLLLFLLVVALFVPQSWNGERRWLVFWAILGFFSWRILPSNQTRFIVAVVPLLMLVTVTPLQLMYRVRWLWGTLLIALVINLLAQARLPENRWKSLTPAGYREARDTDFSYYKWKEYGRFLKPESKIFCMFDNLIYYSRWECLADSPVYGAFSLDLLKRSGSSAAAARWLVEQGVTHVMVNWAYGNHFYFDEMLTDAYSYTEAKREQERKLVEHFLQQECHLLLPLGDAPLYEIHPRVNVKRTELLAEQEIAFHGAGLEIDLEETVHPQSVTLELSNQADYEVLLLAQGEEVAKIQAPSSGILTPGSNQIMTYPVLKTICLTKEVKDRGISGIRILPVRGEGTFFIRKIGLN